MTGETPPPRRYRTRIGLAAVVGLVALGYFARGAATEPHFVDESAYYAQSGYADLLLTDRNNPAWLDYAGYDLPPLPKYLIGGSLWAHGYPRPNPRATWEWYKDTRRRFETPDSLTAARIPSVIVGAIGCVAILALATIPLGPVAGLTAAILLMINPLYLIHSRRAMSDVPAEAFLLVALATGLWGIVRLRRDGALRAGLIAAVLAGTCVGLSVLSKLNGVISGVILAAWVLSALVLPAKGERDDGLSTVRAKGLALLGAALAGVLSFLVFVALNPFLTAKPSGRIEPRLEPMAAKSFKERAAMVAEHRVEASRSGQDTFPNDALRTPVDKIKAVAVQGFGRFGPFGPTHSDSTVRFDARQDWGAWIWGPAVVLGLVALAVRGRETIAAGGFPAEWALLIQALIALAMVTAYIPLAWDRYYISIQPGSCLAVAALVDTIVRKTRGRLAR